MVIYKHYNQEQLNNQYNNRLHVPDFADYLQGWEKQSIATREKYLFAKDIAYGEGQRERLDILPSVEPGSKTLVFIHGGYWQMFDKTSFHFIADAFHLHDVTTVLINYPLAPVATMDEMVASCRKAMLWLKQNLLHFNGDPEQVYVAGHSAGGHLAAMLMERQWAQSNQNFIRGICAISGLFNLTPIQLSYVNAALQMDEAMAIGNSPVALEPVESCALLLAVGGAETEEFKDQSMELYNAWKNKTGSVELLEMPGLNHFSIVDSLANIDSLLHKAMCTLMGI